MFPPKKFKKQVPYNFVYAFEDPKDALKPEFENHKNVLNYADAMRSEYLNTVHYIEVYLKNAPTK